jgi:hypothetical protein
MGICSSITKGGTNSLPEEHRDAVTAASPPSTLQIPQIALKEPGLAGAGGNSHLPFRYASRERGAWSERIGIPEGGRIFSMACYHPGGWNMKQEKPARFILAQMFCFEKTPG